MDVWKGEGQRDEVRSRGRKSRYLGSRNIQERLSQRDTKDSVRQQHGGLSHTHTHTQALNISDLEVTLLSPMWSMHTAMRSNTATSDKSRRKVKESPAEIKTRKSFCNYREQRSPTYTRWDGATGIGAKNLKSWMLHWEKKRKVGRVGGEKKARKQENHATCNTTAIFTV